MKPGRRTLWCWLGLHDWVVIEGWYDWELLDARGWAAMATGREIVRRICLKCHKYDDQIGECIRECEESIKWHAARRAEAERIAKAKDKSNDER